MPETYYPLTNAQKRIWYTEKFYSGTSVSNLGGFLKFKTEVDIEYNLWIKAVDEVVRLNESMRLRLAIGDEGEPRQYVADYQECDIEWFDFRNGDVGQVWQWGQAEFSKPMTLYNSDLLRLAGFEISDKECWFFVKVHHVIADGISIVLFVNQIVDTYLELVKGIKEPQIARDSYVDYIQTETAYELSDRFQKDKAYWSSKFADVPEASSLKQSDDHHRMSTEAVRLSKVIPAATQRQIHAFCEGYKVSVLTLFLALVDTYLYRATGQDDVVVGTFMGNRTNAKEKQMLGMFVSTIPIRTHVDGHTDFLSFVRQKTKDQMAIIRHQKYPYTALVSDLRKQHGNINRLFGISLEFQVMQWFEKDGVSYLTEPVFSGSELNDLSIHVKERWDTGTLNIDLDYRTALFSNDEIENFYRGTMTLLEDALAHPLKTIDELKICSREEEQRLLAGYEQPPISFPQHLTLHRSFERQAARIPEQTAVVFDGKRMSYTELNQRANQLGWVLRAKGIGPNAPVAICINRSDVLVTAILGVLKAGGVYVPIDPDLPSERIKFMIRDSGAQVLLTEQRLLSRCDFQRTETVVMDHTLHSHGGSAGNRGNLPDIAGPEDLAYVIYTSGTTGKPKGVMIQHRQVQHLVAALDYHVYAAYQSPLNVALVAPFHFDASVQQIFPSLLLGHTLCIVPKPSARDGQALADYYRSNQIDVTDGTPAHLQMLLASGNLQGVPVRHMLIGGEPLRHETVQGIYNLFAENGAVPTITNVYGPTECCVDASAFDFTPTQLFANTGTTYVPIGKPLGNHRLYILDAYCKLQPAGVQGELYIAGAGVGCGYLNLPRLSVEKFIADPFVPGETMYKTGDLVRRLADGNIEFLGRMDDQVKIRGYRIELGEIEAVLQKHASIQRAVVLARPNGQAGAELCAYVVFKQTGEQRTVAALRAHLSAELPSYMLPTYFVELEEIPLTSSGKVDRKLLLTHAVVTVGDTEYVAPANELEAQLAEIWQDVLGVTRVGVYDQFFELGGHSLKAITLLSRIHKACKVEVPLQVLFDTPTVHAMALYIAEADYHVFEAIVPAHARDFYPLSFAQQLVYVTCQLEDGGISYNMPVAIRLDGPLDVARLEVAFRGLIQRHEALRTSFIMMDGVPMQKVHDDVAFEIGVTQGEETDLEAAMAAFVRPFELNRAPLMRAEIVALAKDHQVLLFDMHHLISDGVSSGIILGDLARLYEEEQLQMPRLQYKDFVTWQSGLSPARYEASEKYWLDTLGGELPGLQLLTDYPRPPVQSFHGDRVSIVLNDVLKGKLSRLAEHHGTTLYMVMLAAYYVLLARYTGQEDIIVGTPVAGRNHADLEGIVGMFVNTLAIRTAIEPRITFANLLHDVTGNALAAFEHQNYPFEWLVDKLNLPRDLSRSPLFDTMFSLQTSFEEIANFGETRLSIHETNFHVAKFDLTLQATEERDRITVDLDYSTSLFHRDTARRMMGHYLHILESIAADTATKVGELILLSEAEAHQLLVEFNPPATDYPKLRTIVSLFEEQTHQTPDSPALVFEGTTLTYAQLNAQANQLARALRAQGVSSGSVVALLVNRSAGMVTGILAILKTGAAYVPIDPEHPGQRIKYLLSDSGASLLLTEQRLSHMAFDVDVSGGRLFVDDADLYQGDASNLDISISSSALANLTYTSGTTGTPKGNMVTHSNIVRTVKCTNYLDVTNQDILLSLSNYVFDAFMFDLFGALLNGAKLVLAPKDVVLNIARLPHVIERERITILMITTALFNLLVDVHPDCFRTIRKVLFGGERASVDHVRKALATVGKGKLLHMYGPSESTVFATYYPVNEVAVDAVTIPIGKPVSNTTVYVLNSFQQLQPIGAAGELCVGGDGLVLGYANRPELTGEKFVKHPFAANQRIYRTGDLVRQLADGNIEFLGRTDDQVKIRGQRIELGEIEHQLVRHAVVREAVVVTIETASGDKQLCAYVVADAPLSNSELREHLMKELPAYMVPAALIQMEELPLTGNGKIDRRALPKPDLTTTSDVAYVASRNEMEAQLANIWQEVLGIERVGVHDNFFDLGGHSLKAMMLLPRIHQAMNVELPLRALFQSPTVEELARQIAEAKENPYSGIAAAAKSEVYPLSSAQKRLYVLAQIDGALESYNMPAAMRIVGPFDRERFETTMTTLVERHEALRTSFETVDDEPVQRIHEQAKLDISYWEAAEDQAEHIISEFIRPFSLNKAPLMRMGLIQMAEEQHLLLFDMHHIISDGVSMSVLIDEITTLYAGETLEPLSIQYKDYAVWQHSFRETQSYRQQEAYWLAEYSGELPVLNLPADYTRPAIQSFAGDGIDFTLDTALTQSLNQLAQSTGTTLYMVLLASYSALLARLSGQDDIVVSSPIAGRPHADLANIVGMFVNTLAIRTAPKGETTFAAYLQEVREKALSGYESQDYPFEELVQNVQIQRDMSRNPLFDALFVLQNTDARALKLDGARLEPYAIQYNIAKFDLSLSAREDKDTIRCSMEYNTALFQSQTAARWMGHFIELLRQIAAEPNVQIADINLLTAADERALETFNDTQTDYPRDKTIHQLFEEQVERAPDNVALVVNNQRITYRDLNGKANRLARSLRLKGLQPNNLVGVMVDDPHDMVVSILAILKAGGAYLPLDPNYPEDRVRYYIKDSGLTVALTKPQFAHRLPGVDVQDIDALNDERYDSSNLVSVTNPNHLAYVIYTSGSTGEPKGVMAEHRNVVRLVKNAGYIPLDDTCRMAQTGAMSFDATTFELFGALLNGGALYPVARDVLLDVGDFAAFLREHRITTMWLTSPLFNQLAQEQADMFRTVHDLIIGGDALSPNHVNHVRQVCPGLSVWNGYGPTENTTFSTCFLIKTDYVDNIPIGKPIGNSTAYILGPNNRPQPIGVPGELCVGGDGVARGYLNRPELTSEKFVADPFQPGGRMYRTGDLAKWLPDGTIEFMGRIDRQVKVRGYRIELGEIESQLMQVDDVKDAIVVTSQIAAGANELCAYVVGDSELTTSQLRAALSELLPAYMVPSYFVQVDKIPLSPNGKVDHRALPEPASGAGTVEYKAPRNEVETLLTDVWQDVLGVRRLGISDNFFAHGGDSIKAIQMAAHLHKAGWKLEMKDLFRHPTIEQVAIYMHSVTAEQARQDAVEGEVALTPIQRWFFDRRFTDMHHFNQSVMLHAPDGLDPTLVAQTLRKLVEHHDALRMVYSTEEDSVVQYNRGLQDVEVDLQVIALDVLAGELEAAILLEAERIQASISLSEGPLLKAAIFQTEAGDELLMVIHHLVVDGVSWRILIEDFASGYLQAQQSGTILLPDKTHSFQHWADKVVEYANSKQCLKEMDYWRGFQNAKAVSLPKDFETDDQRMKHTRTVAFSLTTSETEDLTTRVHLAYRTEMNDILLTALGYALQEWTGSTAVPVLLEGHGREEVIENVNVLRTVGWFTTQYPIVLDMNQSTDLAYQIKSVKEDLRHIPNKGIGYGILRYLTAEVNKSGLSFSIAPNISFNYLGQFDDTTSSGWFTRSPFSTGNVISPETEKMNPIDIVGFIEGGVLTLSIAYNSLEYLEQTMERLSTTFKSHLLRIIQHCVDQEDSALTPSDLGDEDLTLEELDTLLHIL